MNTTISVIIPFFNSEKTLQNMLNSIFNSILVPGEIILVDDGSTDSSTDTAKKIALEHPNVIYLHQDHSGVSAARNLGLATATCDYVSFIDADDYIEPDMYRLMADSLADGSFDGCICGYYTHKDNVTCTYTGDYLSPLSSDDVLQGMFTDDNIRGFLFTRLFRRCLLKDLSFSIDITMCEDLLFQTKLFSSNKLNFAYVNKPLYHYVQTSSSATSSLNYFKRDVFIYKPAFDQISSFINKDYVEKSYNSILEYSMYTLLKKRKESGSTKALTAQIRQLQKELKNTSCKGKSKRRLFYEHAPIIYSFFFI